MIGLDATSWCTINPMFFQLLKRTECTDKKLTLTSLVPGHFCHTKERGEWNGKGVVAKGRHPPTKAAADIYEKELLELSGAQGKVSSYFSPMNLYPIFWVKVVHNHQLIVTLWDFWFGPRSFWVKASECLPWRLEFMKLMTFTMGKPQIRIIVALLLDWSGIDSCFFSGQRSTRKSPTVWPNLTSKFHKALRSFFSLPIYCTGNSTNTWLHLCCHLPSTSSFLVGLAPLLCSRTPRWEWWLLLLNCHHLA